MERSGYIMTNRLRGVLYIGVAADLARRVVQHREGAGSMFCRKYRRTRLVWPSGMMAAGLEDRVD